MALEGTGTVCHPSYGRWGGRSCLEGVGDGRFTGSGGALKLYGVWRPIAVGNLCPRCKQRGIRVATPWYLRPLRWLFVHGSTRCCVECGWRWFAIR